MKKLLAMTITTTLTVGLAGCKSTPKADGSDTETPRSEQSTLEHIGHDAHDVGKGTLDAVGSGIDAVGKGISGVFKGDDDKKKDHPDHPDHPNDKGNSDHPDHPGK